MKKILLSFLAITTFATSFAQYRVNGGASIGADAGMFTLGIEREFDVIIEKFHINPGFRINGFSGKNLDYITAPAEYTADENFVDTMGLSAVQNNFANLYVRLGFDVTEKFSLSFDIDVIGVSFGKEQAGEVFRAGKALTTANPAAPAIKPAASPTSVNILLVGDNDKGSLNSTLTLTYNVTKRLGIDLGAGLVFTEYTTNDKIGYDSNDRFRNKAMMGYLGASFLLGKKK